MAIEFGERIRRIPAYPLAAGYDLGADVAMLASNESWLMPNPTRSNQAVDIGQKWLADRDAKASS